MALVCAIILGLSNVGCAGPKEDSMIRSSLVKSACVAIALSGFSPPQADAV